MQHDTIKPVAFFVQTVLADQFELLSNSAIKMVEFFIYLSVHLWLSGLCDLVVFPCNFAASY